MPPPPVPGQPRMTAGTKLRDVSELLMACFTVFALPKPV